MKYPIGKQTFSTLIEGGYVYVDKTDLVYNLAQKDICFFCRPRRFGKSLLISTLESYFKGEKELFKGLKIEELEKDWVKYPVFHVDFSLGGFERDGKVDLYLNHIMDEWEKEYDCASGIHDNGLRFAGILKAAHEKTGQKAVVLIDEYDKPLLDVLMEPMEDVNRKILKAFYSVFKYSDEHLRFVLLTGVTKFSQVSVFSGFNQPEDISMKSEFDALCGITKDELVGYFDKEIEVMAKKYGCTKDEMYLLLKRQYDGYHFSEGMWDEESSREEMLDIFNPYSVLNALNDRKLGEYWFKSGTPTYLMRLLDRGKTNMQEILNGEYESSYFMDYKADIEDPLAMIYQSGYLTIKGFKAGLGFRTLYTLDYPNAEVKNGFVSLLANNYFRKVAYTTPLIQDMTYMLMEGRLGDLRDALSGFFASIPYDANYQERVWSYESHYHYTMYLIFTLLSCYTVLTEKANSRGRADIIVETADYVYIFEFKLDGTAAEALKQIEDKGYAEPYAADKRKLFRIGVAFSSGKKNIVEWEVV
ncbi:MAG: ATP-binding protein [Bacteroidales bacterium]|nr:ATP-binding protein [Bacteroidales bacterium]